MDEWKNKRKKERKKVHDKSYVKLDMVLLSSEGYCHFL